MEEVPQALHVRPEIRGADDRSRRWAPAPADQRRRGGKDQRAQ
jgi:hypothetical protein